MTDLEKAIELARKHEALYGMRNRDECCVAACQEMAEWKKQQMIDKACEWLGKNIIKYRNWEYNEFHECVEYDGSYDIEKMINDFKKVMEE